jgi:dTDP-glucose 4,6-dehydratase
MTKFLTSKKILITGGAGFIGANFLYQVANSDNQFLVIDKLSYAGSLENIQRAIELENVEFCQLDIADKNRTHSIILDFQPDYIFHFAAESHVDNSIAGPEVFIQSNILGTFNLLECARSLQHFECFFHISTDEVFGELEVSEYFVESTAYDPHSPYSATKAASDHLVRAWGRTYGLPYIITNCSNNYGPYQHLEKLIPVVISKGLLGMPIPVYGNGQNERDWLFVDDHVSALVALAKNKRYFGSYNIGGDNVLTNNILVRKVCEKLDKLQPRDYQYSSLIEYVVDRPGHDLRYAIDSSKLQEHTGWKPKVQIDDGLERTIQWYLQHLINHESD